MMLDLDWLRRMAAAAPAGEPVEVMPDAFAEILAELEAGRAARVRTGKTFGCRQGQAL